jgi:hypothetical protein
MKAATEITAQVSILDSAVQLLLEVEVEVEVEVDLAHFRFPSRPVSQRKVVLSHFPFPLVSRRETEEWGAPPRPPIQTF